MTEVALPPSTSTEKPPEAKQQRNHVMRWLTVSLVIAALLWLLYYVLYLQYHESTDDAYVDGNLMSVTSVIPGTPIRILADDTDFVAAGQPLVEFDPTPYQITYERELDALAAVCLQVRQLYEAVKANHANVKAKQALLAQAEFDLANRQELIEIGAVSGEDYVHAQDSYLVASLALKQAEAEFGSARHAVGHYEMEQHPQIEQQKSRVRQAYYELSHCTIRAPVSGYIAQRKCQVGQWVTPNTKMMAVIPQEAMWVTANYMETQLTYMRIGQPATVTFDIYGRKKEYSGTVVGIGSGSGSVFSLIPPQNATGNWIKIVQRVPVRIAVDAEMRRKWPLRLGLSAVVDVDITDFHHPMLAQTPPTQAIAETSAFEIDMEPLEELMDEIVNSSLETHAYG